MSQTMGPNDPTYERRLLDNERERRMSAIETKVDRLADKVDHLDEKVDNLSNKIAWFFGGLAVLSFVLNIVGPFILQQLAK